MLRNQKTKWTESLFYDRLIKEPIRFDMVATLESPAKDSRGMDRFKATIENEYANSMTVDYSTGTGFRYYPDKPRHGRGISVYNWEKSIIKGPSLESVMASLAMDYLIAREMPAQDLEAIKYIQYELGCTDAAEIVRLVSALRKVYDDLRSFCRGTGIDCDDMADYFSERG